MAASGNHPRKWLLAALLALALLGAGAGPREPPTARPVRVRGAFPWTAEPAPRPGGLQPTK